MVHVATMGTIRNSLRYTSPQNMPVKKSWTCDSHLEDFERLNEKIGVAIEIATPLSSIDPAT